MVKRMLTAAGHLQIESKEKGKRNGIQCEQVNQVCNRGKGGMTDGEEVMEEMER